MSAGYPSQPSFFPPSSNQVPPPRRKSWLASLLLIGGGIFILGSVLFLAGIFYVVKNVDRWIVGLGREAIVAMVNEAEIPAADKSEVIAQVDRVVAAYKARQIGQAELQQVLTELEQSPALKALSLAGIEDEYLTDSGLSDEEISSGRRTFERALRGICEGKISEESFFAVLPDFGEGNSDDIAVTPVSNPPPSAAKGDDLREALAKLKVMADNAQIPDEPFQLHIGAEVKKLVDRALGPKG